MDGFLPVGKAGEMFLLQAGYQRIDLHGIFRIEHRIFRHGKALGRAFIGRKVKIIVAEPVHGLIVLRHAWGIEDAGVLFCDYNIVFKIDFHGGFELEEEVIPASCRAVNGVIVLVGTVVFAEIQSVHGGAPCVSGLSPERVISVIIRRFLMKADYPDGSL